MRAHTHTHALRIIFRSEQPMWKILLKILSEFSCHSFINVGTQTHSEVYLFELNLNFHGLIRQVHACVNGINWEARGGISVYSWFDASLSVSHSLSPIGSLARLIAHSFGINSTVRSTDLWFHAIIPVFSFYSFSLWILSLCFYSLSSNRFRYEWVNFSLAWRIKLKHTVSNWMSCLHAKRSINVEI